MDHGFMLIFKNYIVGGQIMRTIQEVGMEILNGNPKPMYIMLGSEYGIKKKYIDVLTEHYGKCIESDSVSSIIDMMSRKHIIPLEPKLYVVRYDDEFVNTLDQDSYSKISKTKIVGTIVCVFDNSKHSSKLDKFLPELTVSIDGVNLEFIKMYLRKDFPHVPDKVVDIATSCSVGYFQAQNICKSLMSVDTKILYSIDESLIRHSIGYSSECTDLQMKVSVASRNFRHVMNVIENYPKDADSLFYDILSTMIELDKCKDKAYSDSPIKKFSKLWTREDIYNMFMQTYNEIEKLRTISCSSPVNHLIYLASLLQFKKIPSVEVLS